MMWWLLKWNGNIRCRLGTMKWIIIGILYCYSSIVYNILLLFFPKPSYLKLVEADK